MDLLFQRSRISLERNEKRCINATNIHFRKDFQGRHGIIQRQRCEKISRIGNQIRILLSEQF